MTSILLVLVWLIPLAYSPFALPFGYEDAFDLKRTVLEVGAMLLLVALSGASRKSVLACMKSPRMIAVLLYVAYLSLHVLFLAPGRIAERRLFEIFCLLVIFVAGSCAGRDEKAVARILRSIGMVAALTAAPALWQAMRGLEPCSTLGNRNFLATLLMLGAVASAPFIKIAARNKSLSGIPVPAILLGIVLAGLVGCKSKAAWLALALTGIGFCASRRNAVALLLLFAAACAGFSWLLPMEQWTTELRSDVRPFLWEGAWRMAMSAPWVGVGLGQFFIHIPAFRSADYYLLAKSADTTLHAHNGILQVFAETGAIGAVMLAAAVGLVLWRMPRKGFPGIIFLMLCAMLVKSFFDMDSQVVSSEFFFWLLLGLGVGASAGTVELVTAQSMGLKKGIAFAACAAFCALVFFQYTLPFARAEWFEKKASQAAVSGQWGMAQEYYRMAWNAEPGLMEIPFRLGYAYARTARWEEAMACYEAVRSVAPFYSNVVFNMAFVRRQQGLHAQSMAYLREGFRINPYCPQGHAIAKELYLLSGRLPEARKEEAVIGMLRSRYR